jgi:hypothetical protein
MNQVRLFLVNRIARRLDAKPANVDRVAGRAIWKAGKLVAVIFALGFIFGSDAFAQGTVRWTGATSTAWETSTNWTVFSGSPTTPPSSGDTVEIGTVAITNQPTITTATSIAALTYGNAAASTLTINGNLSISGDITNTIATTARVHNINLASGVTLSCANANLSPAVTGANMTITFNGGTFSCSGNFTAQPTTATITITLTVGTGTFSVGGTTLQGAGSTARNCVITVSTGTLTFGGNYTKDGTGSTLTSSGAAIISFGGNVTNTRGTFDLTGSTATFNGAGSGDQLITPTVAVTFGTLTVNRATTTAKVTLGGDLTLAGNLNVTSGTFDPVLATNNTTGSTGANVLTVGADGTLIVRASGATAFSTSYASWETKTFNAGSTVDFQSVAAATIEVFSYANLSTSTNFVYTVPANLTLTGNLTVAAGTFDHGLAARTVTGSGGSNTLNVQAAGTLRIRTTGTTPYASSYPGWETLTLDSGSTIEWLTDNAKTWDITSFPGNVIVSDGTNSLGGNTAISGSLTQSAGSLSTTASNFSLTVTGNYGVGGATLTANGSTVTIGGNFTGTGILTAGTSTFVFNGTGAQGIASTVSFGNYNKLTINKTTGTATPDGAIIVNSDFTITAGTLSTAFDFTVGGNWSNNGTFTQTTGDDTTFTGGGTHTLSGSGSNQFGGLITSSQTINAGSSDIRIRDAFTHGTAGVFNAETSTITFNGTVNQTQPTTTFVPSFFNMIIDKSAGTMSSGRIWTVTNNFEMKAGAFAPASGSTFKNVQLTGGTVTGPTAGNISVTGSWTDDAGTFTASTSTVTFNGSSAQIIGGNSSTTFSGLTINNSAGVTLGVDATVNGVLALNSGDITTGANTLNMALTATSSASPLPGFDVVGNVNRTNAFVSLTAYAFGNQFITISFTGVGTKPTGVNINLVKAAPNDFSNAVQRTYNITPTGGSGFSSTVRLHYLDAELNGITDETTLVLWRKDGTWNNAPGVTTTRNTTDNWVQTDGVTQFSPWAIAPGTFSPTAVDMINLKATRYDGRVLLEWQTGYEINNVGFNIYREQKGILTRVTPDPVAGSALIAGPRIEMRAGFAYSWWDNDAENDDDAHYWLEDIDLTGRTVIHGPFGAVHAPAGDRVPPRGKGRSSLLSALGHEASEQGASAPVETMAKVAKLTPARFEVQSAITSLPAVKMSVQREGWYRVEQPELVAAGIPANVDPRRLQLFVDGQEVPMMVTGGKPAKFDAADGVEFYGVGIDSPSTDTHVYWLVAGSQQGQRITNAGGNSTLMAPPAFPYTVERRDKVVYFAGMKNGGGEKFFGPVMFNAQAVDQSLVVRNVAATGSATLEVSVQGLTQAAHNVKVTLNGEELGTIQFSGSAKGVGQYSIAASSLREGTNQVQLVGPAGFGDMSMVEYVRLTYQHTNMADGNALKFSVTGRQKATIGGFTSSNVRVVDITKPAAPQELDATVIQESTGLYSVSATAPGKGAKTLMAFAADQQKKPTSMTLNQPSNWRKPGREADYLAVTRKELISSLEPLKTQRQSQGLVVAIADIQDVYDEFSFGQKTPQALKDFFAYAKSSWAKKPRFALLAGDATYDPKNYTGTGDNDVVPTKLVETSFNETASDDWFVDFDNDGVPDMAIGRLPVRTVEEATAMVSKIVGYDQSFGTGRVLMVTDQNQGYNFEAADTQLRGLMPASVTVTGIRRGEVGDANARSQLLDGINQGQKLVNYYGHGSTRVWTNAPILSAADAASFVNTDKLALFDAMTCLNGFFHDVTIDSLGEALLKSKGAAIAVWASTGMTDPSAQVLMNEEAIRLLFSGAGLTIGEVTARAKAAAGNPDVRRTWVLLGDPATKIK